MLKVKKFATETIACILLMLTLSSCSTTRVWNLDYETSKASVHEQLKIEDSSAVSPVLAFEEFAYRDAEVVLDQEDRHVIEAYGTSGNSFFLRRLTTQVELIPLSPGSTKLRCKTRIHRGILWDARGSRSEALFLDALSVD